MYFICMWFRGWRFKNTYRYNPHGEALWERVAGCGRDRETDLTGTDRTGDGVAAGRITYTYGGRVRVSVCRGGGLFESAAGSGRLRGCGC